MTKLIDIVLPDTDQEGTQSVLENWLKAVGDKVSAHEPLVEISTDKVTMEVSAPADGILKEILKNPSDDISPGEVLGRIAIGTTAAASDDTAAPASPAKRSADAPEAAVESATADSGRPARLSPLARKILESHQLSPESISAEINGSAPGGKISAEDVRAYLATKPAGKSGASSTDMRGKFSPLVRKLLSENSIQPEQISGSGRGGRITAKDVEAFLARPQAAPAAAAQPSSGIAGRMVPHSTTRIHTARHMVDSLLKTAPHVTAVFEADMSAVVAHRAANKQNFLDRGAKLTYTAYFVDALVQATEAAPEVNSRWHESALEIFQDINVGIAAATDRGLIVPVLHRAHTLSLFGIAEQLQALTAKAREGKLSGADVRNGTITITNHGVSGSLLATPIINQPQSAILGIGKLEKRVIVVEKDGKDTTEIKPMCYVTLTIDHRALDGFQANTFLGRFVERLLEWQT